MEGGGGGGENRGECLVSCVLTKYRRTNFFILSLIAREQLSNPILRSEKHMTLPRIGSGGDVGFRPFLSPFPSVPLFSHAVIFLHFCAAHNFRLPTFNATFPHLFFTGEKMGTACQAYNFLRQHVAAKKKWNMESLANRLRNSRIHAKGTNCTRFLSHLF